jgi:hypothetical protein
MGNSEESQNTGRYTDMLRKLSTKEKVGMLRELKMDERIVAILNAEDKIINDRVTSEAIAAEKAANAKAVEAARKMLQIGIGTIEQISAVTGLPIEEIIKLR